MKKLFALVLLLGCGLLLFGCDDSAAPTSPVDTTEVTENTVVRLDRRDLQTPVELTDEDAAALAEIVENGSWVDPPTDCAYDCVVNLGGRLLYYHSECGTFNELSIDNASAMSAQAQEMGGRSLSLSEDEQAGVNAILEQYITLGPDITEY